MTLTHMRCPYCHGKSIEAQRTYTIQCGEPRTMYHCSPCARSFSETRHTPIAQLKTPIALVVQVLAALTKKRREAPAFMPGMDRRWARRAQCPRAQQDPRSA